MIEPVAILSHPFAELVPESEAKQILFDCGNGFGLSAITAKGRRFDGIGHGMYCENEEGLPTQYEVLIVSEFKKLEDGKYEFDLIPDAEPAGWLYIEDIGELLEAIQDKGLEAWPHIRKEVWEEEE